MKRCDDCRRPDGSLMHPSSVGCHWLDVDTVCPHCGSGLTWFRGTAAGDLMDEMSLTDQEEEPTMADELAAVRIWHDPEHEGSCGEHQDRGEECRCPECDEPWPCPERKRQRDDMKWIRKLLDEALYTNTRPRPRIDGREAVRYQSPLNWYADMTYGEHGVLMVVHTPTGDVRSEHATMEWLDGVLP